MFTTVITVNNSLLAQTTFNSIPNNNSWGISNSVINAYNGYVLVGIGNINKGGLNKIRVAIFDTNGDLIEDKLFGANNEEYITGYYGNGAVINDSTYVIAGGANNKDGVAVGMLYFFNSEFDSINFNEIKVDRFQQFSQVKWNDKKKQVVTLGYVNSNVFTQRFWLVHTDSIGNTIHDTLYGKERSKNKATTLDLCSDGGYLLGGWTERGIPNVEGRSNVWVLKTDSMGSVEWEYFFGDSLSEATFSVIESKKEGYYFGGGKTDYSSQNSRSILGVTQPYIVKLDTNGQVVWQKSFGTAVKDYLFTNLFESDDGSVICCGAISGAYYKGDISGTFGYVAKISSDGKLLWERIHYYTNSYDLVKKEKVRNLLYAIQPTSDGGYVASGEASVDGNEKDFWVLKMDDKGCVGTPCDVKEAVLALEEKDLEKGIGNFSVFPNPAIDKVHIEFGIPTSETITLHIVDQSGKVVYDQLIESETNDFTLSSYGFVSGVYFVRLHSSKTSFPVQKLIIQH